ncbi:MAG: methylated-DNA--[protein]-cysteine S-methyltransferase [Flavobacteriales bacterium]|nr:methylated-DNA--[protein]-cysteine S-methyltransferase [Flavobacteriales bacterium]
MPPRRSAPVTTGEPELFTHYHVIAVESPIGRIHIESDGELITRVSFDPIRMRRAKPPKVLVEAKKQMEAFLKRRRKHFDLPLQRPGTPFQKLVWDHLDEIRWGDSRTYQEIADRIGGKAIARTVGSACASNPLPIIVPCHRVIGSNGLLTGYVGGIWRKKWLLIHEGVLSKDLFEEA